ncbi:DUF1906 domain-containing protein [Streptomyces sp. NPDC057694]|uniref:DUF1906 domain-containing protein n=1 Tax=Streptomyces sp. NPDC057694 TaxID=3346216 RepID=UPI00368A94C8
MYRQKMIMGFGVFLALLFGGTAALPEASASGRDAASSDQGTVSSGPDAASSGPDAAQADASSSLPWTAPVRTFQGRAFDICRAPSRDTMRRWRSSDYRAVGVYFGGRGRFCKDQPHLNRDWMRAVDAMGWSVLPVYVGSQSPCVSAGHKKGLSIGRHPWTQGVREARDAVRRAGEVGIGHSSPLYLDMEAYNYRKQGCADRTLAFVRGWSKEVRGSGYVPGFYSSADSGVRHLQSARRAGVRDLPSVVWFARWHTKPHLDQEPSLSRNAWRPERRIHQYAGNVKERHGGRTLVIDRNLVNAPVARID